MEKNIKTKKDVLDTLFFISSAEASKRAGDVDVPLILKCAEEAGKLDTKYSYGAEERRAFIESLRLREKTSKTRRGRFSRKAVVILVAAAILAVTALTAVAIATDLFGLFFDDPREMLEWKDGESRRIDDYEMVITSGGREYESIDQLVSEVGEWFICPRTLPDDYKTAVIYYFPSVHRREVCVKYLINGKEVQYTVQPGREHPTAEELSLSDYEKIVTRNGRSFYIMESTDGYQAVARIDDNVYIVDSENREDVIAFIKSVKEL